MDTLRVRDVMTTHPESVGASAHVGEVFELMEKRGVMHVPVVENGKLRALVSERHVRDALPSVLTLSDREARRRFLQATRVASIWIENPASIGPDAPLLEAIDLMRRHRAGSLPVVDRGELVGIVTSGDLINLLARLLRKGVARKTSRPPRR